MRRTRHEERNQEQPTTGVLPAEDARYGDDDGRPDTPSERDAAVPARPATLDGEVAWEHEVGQDGPDARDQIPPDASPYSDGRQAPVVGTTTDADVRGAHAAGPSGVDTSPAGDAGPSGLDEHAVHDGAIAPVSDRDPAAGHGEPAAYDLDPTPLDGDVEPAVPGPANAEAPLFADGEAERMRMRWHEIQARFVDDPRSAVSDAGGLLDDVVESLTRAVAARQAGTSVPDGADDAVATENLRLALRRYRTVFDRLVSV